jgi:hypothetical protein
MPVVIPARIVDDRIEADAIYRDTYFPRSDYLMPDDAQPRWPQVALDPGLGNKQRPLIALV